MAVGDSVRDRLSANGERQRLLESKTGPDEVIEELFVRALGRQPKSDETAAMRALIGDSAKDPAVYEDILWSLLNSTEFAFNH